MVPDFRLFDALNRHRVPFVVIGGHAVNVHGYARATEDTDLLWVRSPAAETSLLRALEELDARFIGDEIDPSTGIERTYPVTAAFIAGRRTAGQSRLGPAMSRTSWSTNGFGNGSSSCSRSFR